MMAELTLEERVEHLHAECCELRRKLNEKEFIFESEVDDYKNEVASHVRTIADLNKTIKQLNCELKECVSVEKFKSIESRLDEECLRYENLVNVNEKYTKMYNSKNEECESLLKELKARDEMIEASKESIKSMVASFEKYSTIEEELTKAKRELFQVSEERKSLIEEVESLRKTVTYFEEMRNKSVNESYIFLDESIRSIGSPKNRSSCVPESMAVVFDIRYKEIEKELEECKSQLDQKVEEAAKLSDEANVLRNDKQLLSCELEVCKNRIASLEEDVKANCEEVIRLNGEKMVFEDEIRSLNVQIEKCNAVIAEYQNCTANYETKIKDFEVKVSQLISENETSETRLKEQTNVLNKELEEWKQLITDKDSDIQKLTGENSEKKSFIEKLRAEVERLYEEKEQLETHASFLKGDLKKVRSEVDTIQQSLCHQQNEIEILRSREQEMAQQVSRSHSEIDYLGERLRSAEAENVQLKQEVSTLETKVEKRDADMRKSFKDMSSLARKWEERTERYAKRVAEMEEKLKEKTEVEVSVRQLKEEKENIERQLSMAQKKIYTLQEENKVVEDSFNLERMHKERFRREAESLECELRKYKANNSQSANTTFVMPTTINVGHSGDAAAILQAMHSMPNANESISSNTSSSFRRPPPPPFTLSMADEEGEFMNPKNLSDLKHGICETDCGDISGRLSTLQRRNTLMPPHLQCSYPIELQTVSLPSFTEDSMRKGKLVQSNKESTVLKSVDQNRSFRSMEYFKATYRSGNSEENRKSDVPSHFLLSCTPSKIIKRVKYRHKWTPSKQKSK